MLGALLTCALWAQTGSVRFRVTDPSGAVIPGVEISLLGSSNQAIFTEKADGQGEITWTYLPLGESNFRVRTQGFLTSQLTVTIQSGDEQKADVTLQIPACNYLSDLLPQPSKLKWRQILR
jgi:hypothetical protein